MTRKHHKGQYLISVPHASPQQRWVDEICLAPKSALNVAPVSCEVKPIESNAKDTDKLPHWEENLLALSWHNAFCETHRRKKECQRSMLSLFRKSSPENRFILHGLWPQPKKRVYCSVDRKYITSDKYGHWNKLPKVNLTTETRKKLDRIMPGTVSYLDRHEWIKHGTCYDTDQERYFKDAIALVEQVENAGINRFFQKHMGKRISLKQVRVLFDHTFGKGTGSRVELRCKKGLVTELWLHLKGMEDDLGTLLQKGKPAHSRCKHGMVDEAGFSR
jgi:ribonuclease T2